MANITVVSGLNGGSLSMWTGAQQLAGTPSSAARTTTVATAPAAYASISSEAKALAAAATPQAGAVATSAAVNTLPTKSGDKSMDAVIAGKQYWWTDWTNKVATAGPDGMVGAKHELTFSFMATANSSSPADQNGFAAMNEREKSAVRAALAYVSSVADITFSEVGSGGNLQFGTNKQNGTSSGYAYYPNSVQRNLASVYLANDVFNPNTTDFSEGTQAWETLIHEIGHALGLKHTGNYNAGGGGTPGPYLSKAADHTGNSVMSYKSPSNAVYAETSTNEAGQTVLSFNTVAPEGYQMLDIAALQYMYGASKDTNAVSAQTYEYDPAQHNKNRFMETIWNPNSGSEIDASKQTQSCAINLNAGTFSSIGIRSAYADLPAMIDTAAEYAKVLGKKAYKPTYDGKNNLAIAAGSHIDSVKTGSGADTVVGNRDAVNYIDTGGGDDTIYVGSGDAMIEGGAGTDTVCLSSLPRGQKWTISYDKNSDTYTASSGNRMVQMTGVESIKTWNGKTLKAAGKELATSKA